MTGTFTKTKVLITVMTYPHPSDTHQERNWLAGLASRWGTSLGAVIPGGQHGVSGVFRLSEFRESFRHHFRADLTHFFNKDCRSWSAE